MNPLNQLANGDPDDDTDFWLTIPGLRESLIDAEADYAIGRTSGEEEIRTRFGLPPRGRSRPAATWQQNARPPEASLVSDRPETTSDPWSVLGRWIRDTPWFRLVPDDLISPAQHTFRHHDEEGLQALLRPWSSGPGAGQSRRQDP